MKTIRVSIVEDSIRTRQMLQELIRLTNGLVCSGCYKSGEAAVSELLSGRPDVVLVDLVLPGMSGCEVIRRMRALSRSTEFIALSAFGQPDMVFDALKNGASGYLLKRVDASEVTAAIRTVCEGGSVISPSIARTVLEHFQSLPKKTAATDSLSPRECEVLELARVGLTGKQISQKLRIKETTVRTHLRTIYRKLEASNRSEAIAKAYQLE